MRKTLSLILATAVIIVTLFSSGLSQADASSVTIDPALNETLASAESSDLLQVVATFDTSLGQTELATLLGVVTEAQALQQLPMALVTGTAAEISKLQAVPGLQSLYLNRELTYFHNESIPLIGADRTWQELGYDGSGVTVAVLDSGIDGTHPDLPYGSKVVENIKIAGVQVINDGPFVVIDDVPNSDTSSGHGTHVAGSVGGTGAASEGTFTGVAPGASLVGIGAGDGISIFTALAGFDWALQYNQENPGAIDVITNSWGSSGEFDPEAPINVASRALYDSGVVVLFAAGNSGPGTDTLNPYSVAPWVIGVAAGNKDGETLADFSSRGRPGDPLYHPTITAPGVDIISTRAPNTILPPLSIVGDSSNIDPAWLPYYTTMSGTSMATPHVAGVVALMLEANPALTPDVVKQLLIATATPLDYREYEAGAGYVNAYAATKRASEIKTIKQIKDKDGKPLKVYVLEEQVTDTVGPAVASYNSMLAMKTHDFAVDEGAILLDTTLRWDSPMNDLDLFLYDPAGEVAGTSQEMQSLSQSAQEGVTADSPQPGTWSAEVRGWLNGPKTYTLTIERYYPVKVWRKLQK